MDDVLALTLVSLHQDMDRLDRVAQNLVNVNTPGYKREVAAFHPFSSLVDHLAAQGAAASTPSGLPSRMAETRPFEVRFDMHPGTLRHTGEPFDVAITGDGFFEVATPDGPAYTRQGTFHLDARGRLVTAQGLPVMGKDGEILLTTATPRIDAAGIITEPDATSGPSAAIPGTPVAQIKVVRFEDTVSMQRMGEGLLSAGTDGSVVEEGAAHLQQGALENANVNQGQEMIQLLQTARHFESIQKITQGYDEMIGTAIQKLGDLG